VRDCCRMSWRCLATVMIASSLLLVAATASPTGGDRATAGDPVDLFTGLNVREHDDIVLDGAPPIRFTRAYGSRWHRSRAFGIGTSHSYDLFLALDSSAEHKYLDLILANGARARYVRISPGAGRTDAVLVHTASPSEFYMSRLSWNGGGWDLDLKDGSRYSFPPCQGAVRPEQCGLSGYRDGQGRTLTLKRDSFGNLLRISAGWFRKIELRYDSAHRIVRAETGLGLSTMTVRYAYDAGGRLASVMSRHLSVGTVLFEIVWAYQTRQLPSLERMWIEQASEYTYDEHHRMRSVKEPGIELNHDYDAAGRVVRQEVAGWGAWTFSYTLGEHGTVVQTDVVDPGGLHRRVAFNVDGYPRSDTRSPGLSANVSLGYERAPGGNLVTRITVECLSSAGAPLSATATVEREPAENVEQRLLAQCARELEAISPR